MKAAGKKRTDIDGLADTHVASSTGTAFERTQLSGPKLNADTSRGGSGTLTDHLFRAAHEQSGKRARDIERTDRYDVVSEYARGGLGRVLEVRDEHLGRTVAIKELLEASTFAESLFIREALITARLQHPGIVPVHEAGRWPSGDPYYVMKLLSGKSLQKVIREKDSLEQRFELLPKVLDVVETIAYAHSQQIIHRDIKPANIVIGEFGETVVVDWGLARDDKKPIPSVESVVDGDRDRGGIDWQVSGNYSVSGKIVGTPAYMSPEQARGEEVDERTDVYALGALLYEVLSGTPPYPGKRLQDVLEQVLSGPPTPLADALADCRHRIKPDLFTIIGKAMARERDDRYPTAKELAEDLRRFQTGQLVSVHHYKLRTLLKRWVRRNRAALAVAVTGVVLLFAMGVVSMRKVVKERNVAERERSDAKAQAARASAKHAKALFFRAKGALHTDPTTSVALLADMPVHGKYFTLVRALADEARALGVARHVIAHTDEPANMRFTPDSSHLVIIDNGGLLYAIDTRSGMERVLAADEHPFESIAVSDDSAWVAVGTHANEVWTVPIRGHERAPLARVRSPVAGRIVGLWFFDEGRQIRFATLVDEQIHIATWHRATGVVTAEQTVSRVADMTSDNRWVSHVVDGTDVVIAESASGEEKRRVVMPSPVRDVEISEDGARIGVSCKDGTVHVIEVATGTVTHLGISKPGEFRKRAYHIKLSPDGTWLVATARDLNPIVWNLTNEKWRRLVGHVDPVYDVAFAPDSSFLVSVGDDATVRVWDLHSDAVRVLRGHTDDLHLVAVSRDGKFVASTGRDRTVRIWPMEPPEERRFVAHGKHFESIAFIDAERAIVSAARGPMQTLDVATGDISPFGAREWAPMWEGTLSPLRRYVLAHPSEFMRWIREGERAQPVLPVYLVDLHKGTEPALQVPSEWHAHAWAIDDSAFAMHAMDGHVWIWQMGEDRPIQLADIERPCALALSPNAERLALIYNERIEEYQRTQAAGQAPYTKRRELAVVGSLNCWSRSQHRKAQYVRDGERLLVSLNRRGLFIWDQATDTRRIVDTSRQRLYHMAALADGTLAAMFHLDMGLYLVDLDKGTSRMLAVHGDIVRTIQFSPDSGMLASFSHDRLLRIWDLNSDKHRVLRGHSDGGYDFDFADDSRSLATVSRDRTLRIWDLMRDPAPDAERLTEWMDSLTTANVEHTDTAQTPPSR